ncbi:DUF692 family multinuclear iron-containing protein [Vibrio fluvialis]|uniref:DUF692 domain-containing protein n=1 Tax=Vibrio fluvialis PG41 TaxID=1336752 RepID=S7I3C3_VIBFL|nr:DUF692 family multinuclear iron-containing protein [Vibrio fluvialis]EPP22583.1 hypothetical protein L910_4760 [Vibrio fluvialis PG41]MBY8105761.1 DUF692 family protein [Vibrio fluvialis]WIE02232.1 DUF692 family protein [Vibrio fluvialis]
MKVGINWSGQRELTCIKELFENRDIEFVELLIDNFLTTDVNSIKEILKGRPCAFHIMNSQFLHRDELELKNMAQIINTLIADLKPIYISDHIGKCYHNEQALPQMLEVNYVKDTEWVLEKLTYWSSLLHGQLLLENYPSIIPQSTTQVSFFKEILSKTQCGLLFDLSNAFIAEKNTGQKKEAWHELTKECQHFHIAGFEDGPEGEFLVDTHNQCINELVLDYLVQFAREHDIQTISVERDDNFNAREWMRDVDNVRGCQIHG